MIISIAPYCEIDPQSVEPSLVPFIEHLNQLSHQRNVYRRFFRRISRWLDVVNATPEIRKTKAEGVKTPRERMNFQYSYWYFQTSQDVERMLAHALVAVAPELYAKREQQVKAACIANGDAFIPILGPNYDLISRAIKVDVSKFLECVEHINRQFERWECEWERFSSGERYVALQAELRRPKARESGIKSGEVRRRFDAVKLREEADALIASGDEPRYVAGKLAARHHVTPDHIRRILRGV